MKCPVCGKHVAEERYELHVGRHTDAQLDEAGIPAAVGAREHEDGDGVDASALRLGPEGSAVPLPSEDGEEPPDVEAEPVQAMERGSGAPAVAPEQEPEPEPAPEAEGTAEDGIGAPSDSGEAVADEAEAEPTADEGADEATTEAEEFEPVAAVPLEATAPMDVEPAPWGGPPEPVPGELGARRRALLPVLGLLALVVIAAIIAFAVTRNNNDDNKKSKVKATPGTTTRPTFAATPGFPGATGPTATFPPSNLTAPPFAQTPPVPASGPITNVPPPGAQAPPSGDPRSLIQVVPTRADCDGNEIVIQGSITNQSSGRYNVTFSVTVTNSQGTVLGNARMTVNALNPGERRQFSAVGTCDGALSPGDRSTPAVESATPA